MEVKFNIKTEKIDADLSQVVDRIKKQYESLPKAFQKEAIQNAWDVRLDRKKGGGWKIKIYSYKENDKTHLILEDFDTKGMNKERWEAFLSLWKPKKEQLDAGGQGQGKFVLMGASDENILIVESISDELPYRCRFLKNEVKSVESPRCSIKNFISQASPLNHKGTKIWVYNVNNNFLKNLKSKDFIDSIIESWWQILGERFNAEIQIFGSKVQCPKLPHLIQENTLLQNQSVGNFGRIKRLVVGFYEKPLPEIFQGIRVQRANMMICKLPFEVYNKEYQGRFSGYIEFEEDLEKKLKDIERTDHCNFIYTSPWKELKELIRKNAEKFVARIVPSKEEKKIFNIRNLSQIINKANQIINDYFPEILGGGTVVPPITPKTKPPIKIKYLSVNKREVKYDDVIKPSCIVLNETPKEVTIILFIELKSSGVKIYEEKYKLKIKDQTQKTIKLSEIILDKEKFQKGKYTLRATIKENRHDIDTKATSFYLETKREPFKKGFIKKVELYHNPEEPIRCKSAEKGVIKINTGHKDFDNIWSAFSKNPNILNKQVGFYVVKVCLDEAIGELLRIRLKDSQNLQFDELVQEIHDARDKMYQEIYG